MGKILTTDNLYKKLKAKLRDKLPFGRRLALASVRVSSDYPSKIYAFQQAKVAEELGIAYRQISLDEGKSPKEALGSIEELNQDITVTGIIVNKPFPKEWDENLIFSAVDIKKDIEGMSPYNLGKLFLGDPLFTPPTVLSILELIDDARIKLYGKKVTIVGFSNIIGKPLALLLGNKFATVSITHIATYKNGDLPSYVGGADILISAVGRPGLIKGEWIKKGAVVIDVGAGEKDGRLTGDIEFAQAKERAALITPVPGGVGKLTTIFLFYNLVLADKLQG